MRGQMPQKRDEVVEKVDPTQAIPDTYEKWLTKQVEARSGKFPDFAEEGEEKEEEEIDDAADAHEKGHRRKRARGSAN